MASKFFNRLKSVGSELLEDQVTRDWRLLAPRHRFEALKELKSACRSAQATRFGDGGSNDRADAVAASAAAAVAAAAGAASQVQATMVELEVDEDEDTAAADDTGVSDGFKLDEQDESVARLLGAIEAALFHGLRRQGSMSGGGTRGGDDSGRWPLSAWGFWEMLDGWYRKAGFGAFGKTSAADVDEATGALAATIHATRSLTHIQTPHGRARAWLRMALNHGVLESGLATLLELRAAGADQADTSSSSDSKVAAAHYYGFALVRCDQGGAILMSMLMQFDARAGWCFALSPDRPALNLVATIEFGVPRGSTPVEEAAALASASVAEARAASAVSEAALAAAAPMSPPPSDGVEGGEDGTAPDSASRRRSWSAPTLPAMTPSKSGSGFAWMDRVVDRTVRAVERVTNKVEGAARVTARTAKKASRRLHSKRALPLFGSPLELVAATPGLARLALLCPEVALPLPVEDAIALLLADGCAALREKGVIARSWTPVPPDGPDAVGSTGHTMTADHTAGRSKGDAVSQERAAELVTFAVQCAQTATEALADSTQLSTALGFSVDAGAEDIIVDPSTRALPTGATGHEAAALLLRFLEALPAPVLGYDRFEAFAACERLGNLGAGSIDTGAAAELEAAQLRNLQLQVGEMPRAARTVLDAVLQLGAAALSPDIAAANGLSEVALARRLAPLLMRPPPLGDDAAGTSMLQDEHTPPANAAAAAKAATQVAASLHSMQPSEIASAQRVTELLLREGAQQVIFGSARAEASRRRRNLCTKTQVWQVFHMKQREPVEPDNPAHEALLRQIFEGLVTPEDVAAAQAADEMALAAAQNASRQEEFSLCSPRWYTSGFSAAAAAPGARGGPATAAATAAQGVTGSAVHSGAVDGPAVSAVAAGASEAAAGEAKGQAPAAASASPIAAFRGGGRLVLESLAFFITHYREHARSIMLRLSARSTADYPFATAGVHLARALMLLLSLNPAPKEWRAYEASKAAVAAAEAPSSATEVAHGDATLEAQATTRPHLDSMEDVDLDAEDTSAPQEVRGATTCAVLLSPVASLQSLAALPWWPLLDDRDSFFRLFSMAFMLLDSNFVQSGASAMQGFSRVLNQTKEQMEELLATGPQTEQQAWKVFLELRQKRQQEVAEQRMQAERAAEEQKQRQQEEAEAAAAAAVAAVAAAAVRAEDGAEEQDEIVAAADDAHEGSQAGGQPAPEDNRMFDERKRVEALLADTDALLLSGADPSGEEETAAAGTHDVVPEAEAAAVAKADMAAMSTAAAEGNLLTKTHMGLQTRLLHPSDIVNAETVNALEVSRPPVRCCVQRGRNGLALTPLLPRLLSAPGRTARGPAGFRLVAALQP